MSFAGLNLDINLDDLPQAILDLPAGSPPPGVESNLDNPESTAPVLIILPGILLGLMWLFVAGRLTSKKVLSGKFGVDDATCVISALLISLFYGLTTASVFLQHVGTHIWNVQIAVFVSTVAIKVEYLTLVFNPVIVLMIKITFFLLYLHLFRPMRGLRIACWVGIVFSCICYTGFLIGILVLGTPRKGQSWPNHEISDKEFQLLQLSVPLAAFGLAIDTYILVLPMIGIWNLHLTAKRKIGVALVFLTGTVAVIAAALCIVYRVRLNADPMFDITWDLMPIYLTTDVEMTLGIMAACMPSCAGLVRSRAPSMKSIRSKIAHRFGRTFYSSTDPTDTEKTYQGTMTSQHFKNSIDSHISADTSGPRNPSGGFIRVTTEMEQRSEPRDMTAMNAVQVPHLVEHRPVDEEQLPSELLATQNNIGYSMKFINPFETASRKSTDGESNGSD